ncbi:hypothetical protein, partial [Kitasatospora sp. NPDC088351]|uniref:hypothetical protein n=1 Tax=Kitasatospora sp. NPDC088351 TaxID=3155180 RepID=UPI003448237F
TATRGTVIATGAATVVTVPVETTGGTVVATEATAVVTVAVETATRGAVVTTETATGRTVVTTGAATVVTVPVETATRGTVIATETATGRTVIATGAATVVTVPVETTTGRTVVTTETAAAGGAVVTTRAVVTVVATRTTVVGPAPARPGLVAAAVVRSTLGTVLGLVRHCGDSFCCFSSTADRATRLPSRGSMPASWPGTISIVRHPGRPRVWAKVPGVPALHMFAKHKKAAAPANRWGRGLE